MEHLAVQRQKIQVSIVCRDKQILEGNLFLSPQAKTHPGKETVLEFMNEKDRFFALSTEGDKRVKILHKEGIKEIIVDAASEFQDVDRFQLGAKEEAMTVVFDDSTELEGIAYVELPPQKSRAIDFMNHSEKFFSLCVGEKMHIINKHYVNYIIPGR
ncbi:MAG: hypothetical protein AB1393_09705 [Candidatus Edwardsbacteria bacterium]